VIAGSSDDTEKAFSLYQWATNSNQLAPFSLSGFENLQRPEALIAEGDGSFLFVQDFEGPTEQEVVVKLEAQ